MKVFLSSTALDLAAHRKVADETIRRLQLNTVAMEFFGPLPGTPVEECEQLARDSDVLICIVAHRYGYIPEKGRGSITRREVEAAHKAGRDVLVWIVADDHPWTEKKEQDLLADPNVLASPERVTEVAEAVAGLINFKAWLRTTFTPDTFTTPDDLGKRIAVALANYVGGRAAPPVPQDRIFLARLPTTGSELFGREKELQLLDEAWENPTTNIVAFVAWGGVGKTALVNHWLKRRMARDNYRGAKHVVGWSFFSQGTRERASSADLFIDQALRWFNDEDPTSGSPWDKGERLARYIRQSRMLLVLDGLEPLQHPPGPQEGRLKDAALQALLVELAAQQPGLCIISTRERVGDLVEFENSTVVQRELEHLSPQASAQILRSLNVKGDDAELEQTGRELGGHAFSLTLLGSYLDEVLSGDIRRRKEIENLFDDTRFGKTAQIMIAAYERWLGEGIDLAIWRLLGFFDRPADAASFSVLRQPPAIAGLTETLQDVTTRQWNQAVAKLRRIKLLAEASPDEPDTLDAHPIVREHFKQQLKREHTDAWREGNNRLYEHLRATTTEFPDTLEEMSPLFAAVIHGCAAGKYQEVLDEVFQRRIQRGSRPFSVMKLGAISANLAVLASFFISPWHEPVAELQDPDKAFVLNAAGFCLRSLGRLQEAAQPMQAGLKRRVESKNWRNAAQVTVNLCELYAATGDLPKATKFGREGVEFADLSKDKWLRRGHRTALGYVLHQSGSTEEAAEIFNEAINLEGEPSRDWLRSIWGFRYCDLLLAGQRFAEVKELATSSLKYVTPEEDLFTIGLEYLSLGRATMLEANQSKPDDFDRAGEFLQDAVDALRQAGDVTFLTWGLLGRAQFYRLTRDVEKAERDLTEVHRLVTRSGMDLHLADYHMESTLLRLAEDNRDKAREHLATAKQLIDRIGYHRRDTEVQELEAQLG